MSDFTEFVDGLLGIPDPKALTATPLVDKEAQNIKNAIVRLPPVVQPFLDTEVTTAQDLLDASIPFAVTAVGGFVSAEAPTVESLFFGLLAKALGGAPAAAVETVINEAAATPWGQVIIKNTVTAAQAMLAHLGATASAGAVGSSSPPAAG
jgi:hypothetical protein